MFLEELEQEEKTAFLELAVMIASSDGNVSIFETTVLNKYQKELELEDYKPTGMAVGEILKTFKSERSKNIVLTELFQLIYADGVFQDEEGEFVRLIKEHFGFEEDEFNSFKDWIEKIRELSLTKEK
ncbi:TerB family tellurite resistance protein [Neobacillus cucumis]|uniref:TerB family tellurite resistance protein n=1 Tax=Neobacillus cucumis TaxID=1740721 RepID=UPI0028533963|nr:TerB family tellurite resistance protein [Neobacillus cucumis]MDR4945397.1 TerB family tellurite resistance protein [Neobacillus cucumis]